MMLVIQAMRASAGVEQATRCPRDLDAPGALSGLPHVVSSGRELSAEPCHHRASPGMLPDAGFPAKLPAAYIQKAEGRGDRRQESDAFGRDPPGKVQAP